MKTYRVYLTSGASFTIKADRIENPEIKSAARVYTKGEKQPDEEVYLLMSAVAAIVPVDLLASEDTEVK